MDWAGRKSCRKNLTSNCIGTNFATLNLPAELGVSVMSNDAGQIGPHEDKEFALFESGQKDLIYFAWDWQPENHKETAKNLGAQLLTFEDINSKLPNYIYFRQGLSNKAKELKDIMLSDLRITDPDWAEKEHRIGELLGYSKQDVELFLKNFRKP